MLNSKFIFIFFNVYLFSDKQREWERGREKEREKILSRLHTVSTEPDVGPELTKP